MDNYWIFSTLLTLECSKYIESSIRISFIDFRSLVHP